MLITTGLLLVVVAGLYAYVFSHKKELLNYAVGEINKHLDAKMEVKEADLSLFHHFPMIDLSFEGVTCEGAGTFKKEPLFSFGSIKATFNPLDIWKGRYRVKSLTLENGFIHLRDSGDLNNYEIFKESKDTSGDGSFTASVQSIVLKHVHFGYYDLISRDSIGLNLSHFEASGNFGKDSFNVDLSQQGNLSYCSSGKVWLQQMPLNLSTSFVYTKATQELSFRQSALQLGEVATIVNGNICLMEGKRALRLGIEGKDIALEKAWASLPESYRKGNESLDIKGRMNMKVQLEGSLEGSQLPQVTCNVSLHEGYLHWKEENMLAEKVSFQLYFTNGKKRSAETSAVELKTLSAVCNKFPFNGSGRISNFEKPYLDCRVKGRTPLAMIFKLIKPEHLVAKEGTVEIDATLQGFLHEFQRKEKIQNHRFEGKLRISDAHIVQSDPSFTYSNMQVQLQANPQFVTLDYAEADINGNKVRIEGKAYHFIPFLFGSEEDKLEVNGKITSPGIRLDNWLRSETTTQKTASKSTALLIIPRQINFNLEAMLDSFSYARFKAARVSGHVRIYEGSIDLQDLNFLTMQGKVQLNGFMVPAGKDNYKVSANLDLENIDLKQLFYQCNDFSQTAISHTHIGGKADAAIVFSSTLSSSMDLSLDRLHTKATLNIRQGNLSHYAPLSGLSKFISMEELEDIHFEALQNTVEIKNKTVFIPFMDIKNSALDLQMGGFHRFDNYMEYSFVVRVGEVLAKKQKSRLKSQVAYDEEGNGTLKAYILLKGTPSTLAYSYDKKKAMQTFREDMKKEKQTFKQLWQEEFRKDKRSSEPAEPVKQPENWEEDIPQ